MMRYQRIKPFFVKQRNIFDNICPCSLNHQYRKVEFQKISTFYTLLDYFFGHA